MLWTVAIFAAAGRFFGIQTALLVALTFLPLTGSRCRWKWRSPAFLLVPGLSARLRRAAPEPA